MAIPAPCAGRRVCPTRPKVVIATANRGHRPTIAAPMQTTAEVTRVHTVPQPAVTKKKSKGNHMPASTTSTLSPLSHRRSLVRCPRSPMTRTVVEYSEGAIPRAVTDRPEVLRPWTMTLAGIPSEKGE